MGHAVVGAFNRVQDGTWNLFRKPYALRVLNVNVSGAMNDKYWHRNRFGAQVRDRLRHAHSNNSGVIKMAGHGAGQKVIRICGKTLVF